MEDESDEQADINSTGVATKDAEENLQQANDRLQRFNSIRR